MGGPELLDVRISQIESGNAPPTRPVSRGQMLLTRGALAALAAVLLSTVVALGGPGAMMREAMGPESSMDGEMWMGWSGWRWLLLLLAAGLVLWIRRRRVSS